MSGKGNIAIFVPHQGCPNQCSFCNQKTITATSVQPTPEFVKAECEKAIEINKGKDVKCEIAFFGGSFTAIDEDYMISLLEAASSFLKYEIFSGIRISTRPDAIDEKILELLKFYGVTAIELGAQSLNDEVLSLNKRGHTALDVENASRLIKKFGFSLGLQMMTGLFGDSDEKAIDTARKIIEISPETVRIYPTVVLKDTLLDELRINGIFKPKTVEESVPLCAKLIEMFEAAEIKVIRVGLHSEMSVEKNMTGGAYHQSFRELCESEIFLKNVKKKLEEEKIPKGKIIIYVNPKSISKMTGQRKSNIFKLNEIGYDAKISPNIDLNNFDTFITRG
ncbi:MAG: radical SAM protein [Oscillospiraceae bacterium]